MTGREGLQSRRMREVYCNAATVITEKPVILDARPAKGVRIIHTRSLYGSRCPWVLIKVMR